MKSLGVFSFFLVLFCISGLCQAANTQQIVAANTKFSVSLYSQYASKPENLFFSPYSISSALGMTYEGAKGETALQMEKVFGFIPNATERHEATLVLAGEINAKGKPYILSTANALWLRMGYKLLDEYTDVVDQFYGGKVTQLDFANKSEEARLTINAWVEKQTHDKIKGIISTPLPPATSLVLTNAVYFLGNWEEQFDVGSTSNKKFWTTPTTSIETPLMTFAENPVHLGYTETDTYQALNLPYKGRDLSMMIILPKSKDIKNLESILSSAVIEDCQSKTKNSQRVVVSIPKFKIETTYLLAETLTTLGMPNAFQFPTADFSGIDGTRNLFISKIIHKAFVEVNETGTEAAAATAIIAEAGAMPGQQPPTYYFTADHPFIFVIQQQVSGNILFMGRVLNPTSSL